MLGERVLSDLKDDIAALRQLGSDLVPAEGEDFIDIYCRWVGALIKLDIRLVNMYFKFTFNATEHIVNSAIEAWDSIKKIAADIWEYALTKGKPGIIALFLAGFAIGIFSVVFWPFGGSVLTALGCAAIVTVGVGGLIVFVDKSGLLRTLNVEALGQETADAFHATMNNLHEKDKELRKAHAQCNAESTTKEHYRRVLMGSVRALAEVDMDRVSALLAESEAPSDLQNDIESMIQQTSNGTPDTSSNVSSRSASGYTTPGSDHSSESEISGDSRNGDEGPYITPEGLAYLRRNSLITTAGHTGPSPEDREILSDHTPNSSR